MIRFLAVATILAGCGEPESLTLASWDFESVDERGTILIVRLDERGSFSARTSHPLDGLIMNYSGRLSLTDQVVALTSIEGENFRWTPSVAHAVRDAMYKVAGSSRWPILVPFESNERPFKQKMLPRNP